MIELIGAPFDLCGRVVGSRMGPMAVRLSGIERTLSSLGQEVVDAGDAFAAPKSADVTPDGRLATALDAYRALKQLTRETLQFGRIPLVMGGDHSLSLASVSAALEQYDDGLGVLWIDAHMDFNTPASSPSGNLHGMPLGALCRLPASLEEGSRLSQAWEEIMDSIVPVPGLRPEKVAWLGLRDVDEGEGAHYRAHSGGLALTMDDVDVLSVVGAVERIKRWQVEQGIRQLWISFDIDVLDPHFAPGTGTKVRGGLSYREGHLLAELLHDWLFDPASGVQLAGLDAVEVNPMVDVAGETANMATEWLASLFGKKILRRP